MQGISNEATFSEKEEYFSVVKHEASHAMINLRTIIENMSKGAINDTGISSYDAKRPEKVEPFSSRLYELLSPQKKSIEKNFFCRYTIPTARVGRSVTKLTVYWAFPFLRLIY